MSNITWIIFQNSHRNYGQIAKNFVKIDEIKKKSTAYCQHTNHDIGLVDRIIRILIDLFGIIHLEESKYCRYTDHANPNIFLLFCIGTFDFADK